MPPSATPSSSSSGGPEFIDWDGPLLERAASRLVEDLDAPTDLGDALLAVPGARAGRQLLAHLGAAVRARGWSGFFPPRVLTQGRLVDELLELERPVADRLTRTFAWERTLAATGPETLARLVARPPAAHDRAAWWRIAEDVRTLHAELAQWGLDFAAVRSALGAAGAAPATELRRWDALAAIQAAWRTRLDGLGLDDPHEGRRHALDAGRVRKEARVVLVGVVDMNVLLRRALEQLAERPRVLIFAPEEAAEGFDDLGCLLPDRWQAVDVDLPLDQWHVVDTPDDQARMALALAGRDGGPAHAADLSIGVPDEEVVPYLTRRLHKVGVRAREAAGTPFERTAPARLLEALAAFVGGSAAPDAAALVRHADLERALARTLDHDPVARLDAYRPEHLPRRLDPAQPDVPKAAERRRDLRPLLEALDRCIGPLGSDAARPLAAVVADVRAFLTSVYDAHPLLEADASGDGARELGASLELAGAAIGDLERVPSDVGGEVTPAAGIGLVLRTARTLGGIPSPPAREDESVVELLGWLELLFDDAPHLVVTGFDEGRVPEGADGDAFLPDRVRTMLGVEDEARRVARDVYTTRALLASRERIDFVSGRRTRDGDPLFPSRLAFFAPDGEARDRIAHSVAPRVFAPVERTARPDEADLPPVIFDLPAPETIAVTAFKTYLDSPLLFHLRRVRRLEPVDDRAGELDSLKFGTFAHDLLEAFGAKGPTESTDAGEVFAFLDRELDRARARRFPDEVLPAVPLQLAQLRMRLRSFSEWQARRAAEGWRIRHVEWQPEGDGAPEHRGCARLDMGADEAPAWVKGKIDRIEQHVDGRWAVFDYKTSRKSNDPEKAHRSRISKANGGGFEWRDLQLPLYAFMVEPLVGKGVVPELGYVNLPGDGTEAKSRVVGTAAVPWDWVAIEDALERAREIVRAVRAGDFTREGRLKFLAPIEEELLGVGLVRAPEAPVDEEPGGDA